MGLVTAVVMLALIEYFIFSLQVGMARGRFDVPAPATTGNPDFERYFRAAANTGEQLLMFIPGMYAFGYYVNPMAAAGLGVVFIGARALYFRTYTADAEKRGPGMMGSVLANAILVVGGLIGALLSL